MTAGSRPTEGGGGSAEGSGSGSGGGGYLATCTVEKSRYPEFRARPEPDWLQLLAASGVNRALLRVAERVGFETFMEVWSALADEDLLDERRRVHVPLMEATLLRYQRAQMIREMGRRGMKPKQILKSLPPSLRGHLSRRTVVRIITGK